MVMPMDHLIVGAMLWKKWVVICRRTHLYTLWGNGLESL